MEKRETPYFQEESKDFRKRKADAGEEVHSANEWEKADLGDNERKNKFLRLMGASGGKKDHHSKIHIGESHTDAHHSRTGAQNKELEKGLEDQYVHGAEYTTYHSGLGFHEAHPGEEDENDQGNCGVESNRSKASDESASVDASGDADVKSFNKWEKVDLGDSGRKNKFLRLMGASKTKAKPDSASSSATGAEATGSIEGKLEEQYKQGLELKLSGATRRHKGLGYTEPPSPPQEAGADEQEQQQEDGAPQAGGDQSSRTQTRNNESSASSSDGFPSRLGHRDSFQHHHHGSGSGYQHGRGSNYQHGQQSDYQHGRRSGYQHGRQSNYQHGQQSEFQHGRQSDYQHGRQSDYQSSDYSEHLHHHPSDYHQPPVFRSGSHDAGAQGSHQQHGQYPHDNQQQYTQFTGYGAPVQFVQSSGYSHHQGPQANSGSAPTYVNYSTPPPPPPQLPPHPAPLQGHDNHHSQGVPNPYGSYGYSSTVGNQERHRMY